MQIVYRNSIGGRQRVIAGLLATSGLVIFSCYLWLHLDEPFAYITGLRAWERGEKTAIDLIFDIGRDPFLILKPWNFIWLNIAAATLCLIASIYWWTKCRYDYLLYCLIPTVSALLTGTVLSISRSTLLLFPVFIALGVWSKTRERELSLLAIFAILLAVMCVLFARGANTAVT
jgi:hypothetical protein